MIRCVFWELVVLYYDTSSPLEKGRAKGAGWIHEAVRKTMWDYPFPLNVIPAEVEGSFLQTGKT